MSTEVSKVVYRIPLDMEPQEVLSFFRDILGEPEEVYYSEDNEIRFYYDDGGLEYKKTNPTDFKEFVCPCRDVKTNKWGLEVIISIMNHDRYNYIGLIPNVLSGHAIDIDIVKAGLLDLGLNIDLINKGKLYAYTWYNGGDEPVYID